MNQEPEKQTEDQAAAAGLQHEAEHARPGKKNPVLLYLLILFAAAFLLLLMSYFMQQRVNLDAMNDLKRTSNSATQSLENLIAERDALEERVTQLEEEQAALQSALINAEDLTRQAKTQLTDTVAQCDALTQLNQIRALYNQSRHREAKELLAQWEAVNPGALEAQLAAISAGLSQEAREIYDPLEAYHTLVGWLA